MKNFVVYKSSAGSGKTFTLVKEYLRLSLHDERKLGFNYRRILAITFTNKAAAEMKSRVITALNEISNADKQLPFIGNLLCDELSIEPIELRRRAEIVLSSILHHYSDFAIGTIDSFTHKIVKTFAHDLKLPVNFNIELDTKSFYEKVIALLFNQVGEDEYVSKLLKDFVLRKAESNSSWDPEKQIQEFSALLQKENSENYIQQLKKFNAEELESFRKQFIDYTHYYLDTLKSESQKAISLIASKQLSDDDFIYKKSGPVGFFRKCFNGTASPGDANGPRLTDTIIQQKWAGSANSRANDISSQLSAIAGNLVAFINEHHRYYSLCALLANQMYSLMLLKKIEEISLEQKQEERLVFLSEFNQRIFEIINNEPTPFIYERLGERYQHYLLDEFQDTSSLQWQNILPLLDNSLSNGWFNLIVGDGKQSIYRWRNANVNQFALLPLIENSGHSQSIAEREDSLKRNFEERVLNTNFRSQKTIVEFNNKLFDYLAAEVLSDNSRKIYNHHQQQSPAHVEAGGYVSLQTTAVKRNEMDEMTCNTVLKHIKAALDSGYNYGDVCILARKNIHGNVIAAFLVEHNIPVVSSDSLLLKNNPEVNTLLSFLSYMVNNHDNISAAAVLNYLFIRQCINEAVFHECLLLLTSGVSLFDVLKRCNIHLQEEELSLNNLVDNCILISEALKLQQNAFHYIRFFLDEVNEFLVSKNSNISLFFEWWKVRGRNASMIMPEGTNAVKIMTIHASKGLEFPVVIVPYCNWAVYKANDDWVSIHNDNIQLPVSVVNLSKKAGESGFDKELAAEEDQQLLDNINLLYVAFTRAVERLHILALQSPGNNVKSIQLWLEPFAKQCLTGPDNGFYSLGQLAKKAGGSSTQQREIFTLEPLSFNTNNNVVRIKASYLNTTRDVENARQQGLLVHWLLSKIKTAGDIPAVLQEALLEGMTEEKELPALHNTLHQLLELPELKPLFAPGNNSKTEAELITANAEILRPDRITITPQGTTLVDYKTGKRNDKKYFTQLIQYENALLSMGYNNVKKLLLYVDEMAVVELK